MHHLMGEWSSETIWTQFNWDILAQLWRQDSPPPKEKISEEQWFCIPPEDFQKSGEQMPELFWLLAHLNLSPDYTV